MHVIQSYFSIVCTNIENCADIRCTTDSDQYCFECESNYGAALGESAYRNLNTSCEGKLILIIILTFLSLSIHSILLLVGRVLLSW